MTIKILPPQLANQIAAGEVVERPASVVKELVENALDANATKIDIEIERGGHKRILIRDDGKGINKEQLSLALSRHATSKIANIDDLEAIMSLGFRGEALASISSVSRLTMTSKPAAQKEAWSAMAEGLDMAVQVKPAAHPNGTSVDVVDLFFNTPARRKFLRAEKTEFGHIESLIKRIALSRPDVTFVLKHNGKLVKRYRGHSSELEVLEQFGRRIGEVVNPAFVEQCQTRELNYDQIQIKVWVKQPELCVSVNPAQFSFVNGRMMRDKLIQHAIRQAFAESLHSEQQPEYVVFIDLPATDVDVNVHPAKHEVRFHHSRLLHDLVVRVIQDALNGFQQQQQDMLEEHEESAPAWLAEPNQAYSSAVEQTQISKSVLQPSNDSNTFSALKPRGAAGFTLSKGVSQHQQDVFQQYVEATKSIEEPEVTTEPALVENSFPPSNHGVATPIYEQPELKSKTADVKTETINVLFIEKHRYVYFNWRDDLYLIDWYKVSPVERHAGSLSEQEFLPTPLLVPVRLKLAPEEIVWCESQLDTLQAFGFEGKLHGQFLIIKQVPNLLRQASNNHTLPRIFDNLMALDELTAISIQNALTESPDEPVCKQQVLNWFEQPPNHTENLIEKFGLRLSGAKLLKLLTEKNF